MQEADSKNGPYGPVGQTHFTEDHQGWLSSAEPKRMLVAPEPWGPVFCKGAGRGEVSVGPGSGSWGSWCPLHVVAVLARAHSCCCLLLSGA